MGEILPFLRAHSLFCVLKMKLMKYRVQSGLDCTDGRGDDKMIRYPFPFRAEGTQSKPTIIFRGQATRLSRLEKVAWDPRFIVTFQKCNKYNLFISTFPLLNFFGGGGALVFLIMSSEYANFVCLQKLKEKAGIILMSWY